MCQVLEITYTSFGIVPQATILVPGINFDGTYYEYYFNTQYFSGTYQTAEWRIKRNPGVPQWELDILVGGIYLTAKGIAPDAICPKGPWTTPGTELIDILEVQEFTLGHTCTVWTQDSIPNLDCCQDWENAIFYVNPKLENILHPGQYLELYTDLFGPSAETTGSFQDEFQGVRILTLVYLKDNCVSFNKCDGGTFLGILLINSNNKLVRKDLFTTLTFSVLGIPTETFTWNGEILNCKKFYTFSSDWSGPVINYRIYWIADSSTVPGSGAPIGTPGWILEEEVTPGVWQPAGFLFTNSISPVGQYLTEFGGLDTRFSIEDSTLPSTGVFCFCYEEPVDNCFELTVWEKQCEFSKCVLNYLHGLMFGNVDCEALENLKLQRRILEILNCYDTDSNCCDTEVTVTINDINYIATVEYDEYGNILTYNGKQYYVFLYNGDQYYVYFNGTNWVIAISGLVRITEDEDCRITEDNFLRIIE